MSRDYNPYYGFAYMWCDLARDMFYIGSHKGSLQDGYLCSSSWCKKAIKKRPETFKRLILGFAISRKDLFELEERYLKFYNVDKHSRFYNFKSTANGGSGPSATKGKSRKETCGPDYIDPRKGKAFDQIYGKEEADKRRKANAKRNAAYVEKHGYGVKKGKKHSKPDWRKGKTHKEIYGFVRHANPPKPFIVEIIIPGEDTIFVECKNEDDFFEKTKLETTTLMLLKRSGIKTIKRRLKNITKHNFPVNTVLRLKYFDGNA